MAKNKKTNDEFVEIDTNKLFANISAGIGGEILDDRDKNAWPCIDTGILGLNYILSGKFVGGGVPGGTVLEGFGGSSSGKSLFGTNLLRGCQTANGIAVMLDAERTLSKDFAVKASHVDPKKFIVLEADTLENAFNRIHKTIRMVRQEAKVPLERPLVIVYDSIAVSPSEREFAETELDLESVSKAQMKEAGAGSDKPGERAKICSKELRKLPPILAENNCIIFFINQIRSKIGVMYGCFSGHSKVLLSDGTWMKICKIVNEKLPVEVMSFDERSGNIVPRRVIDWHHNGFLGKNESFLNITFRRAIKNTNKGNMYVTPNHRLYISKNGVIEEISAGEVCVGDKLISVEPKYLTEDHMQIVYGSILGDGSVRKEKAHNAVLRFGHGIKQKDYLEYKSKMFGVLAGKIGQETNDSKVYCDITLPEINRLGYYKKDYFISEEISNNLNELGLAIWYLDDGTYAGCHEKWGDGKSTIYCIKWKNREVMLGSLKRMGLDGKIYEKGIVFDAENTIKLHQKICRFVPPSMQYKIHPKFWGLFDYKSPELKYRWDKTESEILSIQEWKHPSRKSKFDLTVEGNHNYVVGGALVHNSPETTAGGGMALEFYTSMRLKLSSSKHIKDNYGKVVGINVNVKCVKNKCFRPFSELHALRLFFDKGIDPFGGLLELLIQAERIEPIKPAGTYKVKEPWAGGQEITFKSSKERNDVPADLILKCPALVDATDQSQIQYYLDMFGGAVVAEDQVVEEDIVNEEE